MALTSLPAEVEETCTNIGPDWYCSKEASPQPEAKGSGYHRGPGLIGLLYSSGFLSASQRELYGVAAGTARATMSR